MAVFEGKSPGGDRAYDASSPLTYPVAFLWNKQVLLSGIDNNIRLRGVSCILKRYVLMWKEIIIEIVRFFNLENSLLPYIFCATICIKKIFENHGMVYFRSR